MTIPALSVTCGDSSPKGRAKGLHSSTERLHVIRFGRGRAPPLHSVYRICVPCGYSQRGRAAALPLSHLHALRSQRRRVAPVMGHAQDEGVGRVASDILRRRPPRFAVQSFERLVQQ